MVSTTGGIRGFTKLPFCAAMKYTHTHTTSQPQDTQKEMLKFIQSFIHIIKTTDSVIVIYNRNRKLKYGLY